MLHVRHFAKGNLRVCYVNETSRFPYYSEIMCEKIRKQRPELLVSKVRKVNRSVTMTQSGSLSLMESW